MATTSTTEPIQEQGSHRARTWGRAIATAWLAYQFVIFSRQGAAITIGVDLILIATVVAAWRWERVGSVILMLEGAA
jgi:hypothetical protein